MRLSRPALALGLAVCLLAAWPLRDGFLRGEVAGAGPDVAVTLWALWWYAQEWAGAAAWGSTALVNHPFGAEGTVLAPLSTAPFIPLRALFGNVMASNLLGVGVLAGLAGAAAWAARGLGLGRAACAAAALAMLVGRYPVYGLGEASVVGITGIPVLLGLGALVRGRMGLVALCAGVVALEYPYLILVLPGLAGLRAVRDRSWRWLAVALGALALAWVGTRLVGRGQDAQAFYHHQSQISWLGLKFPVVEEAKARAAWVDLVRAGEVLWRLTTRPEDAAHGRDYLGLSVLGLALLGGRRALPWLLLALLGAALATGSNWFGFPAPFAWLNLLAQSVVRGLSQPTRFLLLANIGLAVAAAVGVERLGKHAWWAVGALLVDALAFGGLSLRMPTLPIPSASCARELEGRQGVLVWPWDARETGDASLQTRYWQMEHGQPGNTFGVGSWRLGGGKRALDALRAAGVREGVAIPVEGLLGLQYDTVLLDTSAGTTVPGLGEPSLRCDGADIYFLEPGAR